MQDLTIVHVVEESEEKKEEESTSNHDHATE